jgi:hypothetical protein
VLDEYAVTFRVMHGHASATAVYDAAQASVATDKPLTVLYVGDRDPSGMHMSEVDLPERIRRYGGDIEIVRIAIAPEDTLPGADVPSFPASDKRRDPRYRAYVQNFGLRCWELDALKPTILRKRVEHAIQARLDAAAWVHALRVEQVQREATARYVAGLPTISGLAQK